MSSIRLIPKLVTPFNVHSTSPPLNSLSLSLFASLTLKSPPFPIPRHRAGKHLCPLKPGALLWAFGPSLTCFSLPSLIAPMRGLEADFQPLPRSCSAPVIKMIMRASRTLRHADEDPALTHTPPLYFPVNSSDHKNINKKLLKKIPINISMKIGFWKCKERKKTIFFRI